MCDCCFARLADRGRLRRVGIFMSAKRSIEEADGAELAARGAAATLSGRLCIHVFALPAQRRSAQFGLDRLNADQGLTRIKA